MNITAIIDHARYSFVELYESDEPFSNDQLKFAIAQLCRLQRELEPVNFLLNQELPRADDFLHAGLKHMADRASTYDQPNGERSMGKTVAAYNIITDQTMTEEQGWLFMGLLKKVRSQQGNYRADHYEDDASYSGLRGECAARDRAQT